jgi:hypothetical protein
MYGPAIAVPCIVLRMLCTSYVLWSVLYSLGLAVYVVRAARPYCI